MVPIVDQPTLTSLRPNAELLAALERRWGLTGIYAFHLHSQRDAKSRMFSPVSGILEDPATGSAAGALGAYLAAEGALGAGEGDVALSVSQGEEIGRHSQIEVTVRWTVRCLVKSGLVATA